MWRILATFQAVVGVREGGLCYNARKIKLYHYFSFLFHLYILFKHSIGGGVLIFLLPTCLKVNNSPRFVER